MLVKNIKTLLGEIKMGLKVDISNPDLFVEYKVKVLTPGLHTFEVANDLKVEKCKEPSVNSMVNIEAVCQDEGEFKGSKVFDRILILANPKTEGQMKSKAINEARLVQMMMACGVMTQEEVEAGADIELELVKGSTFQATTTVGESVNQTTGVKKPITVIENYKFQQ